MPIKLYLMNARQEAGLRGNRVSHSNDELADGLAGPHISDNGPWAFGQLIMTVYRGNDAGRFANAAEGARPRKVTVQGMPTWQVLVPSF